MDWPGLLDHPFWTHVLKAGEDEEEGEEEDVEGDQEINNCCEGVVPASLRFVNLLLFLLILQLLQPCTNIL